MGFEVIGKYEIRGRLGAGAMGTVLDAVDPVIERRAALKIIPRPAADDADGQESLARFKREAQAAGRLNHPNIVAVYDYGEDAERAWIAMELVEGGTLKQVLDRGERLPLAETLRVMAQMLDGLDYSHKRGVVHRDIKPANLMLTSEGQVKIADFGIARIENSSMTQVGTVMGTPSYMAPEQLRGETVDARADIWASGVLLYQLLTGEKPFEGGYASVLHKALNLEPTPPSALSVTAPRGFDGVIAKAMAKRPEDRFQTAGAFAVAIAAAAGAAAAPPEADATLVATAPRVPLATPLATAPNTPPAPLPRKGPPVVLIGGGVAVLVAAGVGFFMLGGSPAPSPSSPEAPVTAAVTPRAAPPFAPPASTAPFQPATPLATGTPSPLQPAASPPAATPPVVLQPAAPPAATLAPVALQPAVPPAATTPSASPALSPVIPAPQPLAPASLPATVAAAPARVDFRAAAQAAAQAPACGLIATAATEVGLTLEGVLRRGEDAALRRALDQRAVPPSAARLALQGFEGPYCPALDLLRPVLASANLAPRVAVDGRSPLLAGDLLRFSVTMPDWPAHLYVAYFMKSGEVAHLVPSATHSPGVSVRLGEPRAGFPGWEVSEPFGTDLLVAVVSEGPLFATARPLVETQEAYLTAMAEALRTARQAGRRILVRPVIIETAAK